ncbi:NACHT domain-containing protein [Streptomyces macrosporus]|uniref:NACHT domain-containing protein n=1 Tax=Streptomyces macrosporus TaxID=44032 RepID=A0ABN3JLX5_9ACTN
MGRGHGQGWALAVLAAVALGAAVVFGARAARSGVTVGGDFDGVGATIALASLAVALGAAWQSAQALRWQETDLQQVTARLAVAVLDEVREARQQLLGDHDKTIDVRFTLRPALAHTADGAGTGGQLRTVVDYYRRLRPRRLVITGTPGAGKTVLALQLMLRLLEQRTADDPVPVRLSLASWNTDEDLGQWITRHLRDVYRLPAASARELVTARRVLPVLDGLDEMDADPTPGYASRAGRAVRAVNRYQHTDAKAELVLTCRTHTYDTLEDLRGVWAQDAARVEISPVDHTQAGTFLRGRATDPGRWQPVVDALQQAPDGPLARALSTPWRLALACTVYEARDEATGAYQRDPTELLAPDLDTPEAVSEHLLDLLIPAVTPLHNRQRGTHHTPEQVRARLTTLAAYLNDNAVTGRTVGGRPLSGTDILLHELWPLAGSRLPRAVHAALVATVWLPCLCAAVVLFQVPIGFSPRQLMSVGGLHLVTSMAAILVFAAWATIWPEPHRADLQRIRTPAGRRRVAGGLALGLAVGLALNLALGLALGLTLALGLALGLASGLVAGLGAGLGVSGTLGSVNPRDAVKNDFTFNLTVGLAFGFVGGIALGNAIGVAIGIVLGLVVGLASGLASMRYVALLVCTRRWGRHRLPWRLGRFLHWCYGAGLLRIAGTAYQFRHRELQDHLASRTPLP